MVIAVVVIAVGGAAAVIYVLAPVLLVKWQFSRLGLVGVIIAVVLWVHHQRPVQVGFHVTTSFPWVRRLS